MATDAFRIERLRDERARSLNVLDDIARTCAEQNRQQLTADERRDADAATASIERIDAELGRGRDVARAAHYQTVQPNLGRYRGVERRHSLDEQLHATAEVVRAGTIDVHGRFYPDPLGATNPVEEQVVRTEATGDRDVTVAPRITAFAPDDRELVRSFQSTVADMVLFGLMVDKSARTSADGFEAARSHRLYADRWADVLRAMDVSTSGEGGAWVPTGIGASVVEKVRAMGRVAPLFMRVDMPTNPWKWPLEGADAVAYRVAEPTSNTADKVGASTPGTLAPTFSAEIFGARTLLSRSIDADSAVATVGFVRNKIARAHAIAEERAVLDGDSDGTHQDADVTSSADARTAWDGLRKRALAQTGQALTTTTAANLAAIRKAMGRWGLSPSELAFVVGISSMHALLGDSNLQAVDKLGPNAVLLAGQIGSLYGIPVVVSEYVREDLNASGVQDGITQTKTVNLCVHRPSFAIGQRMALDVEVDDSIYRESFQRVVLGFQRLTFVSLAEAATDDTVGIAYNVTSGS